MPTDPTGPALEVSVEGRRLIDHHQGASIAYASHLCASNTANMADAAAALSAYVAGLEAEVVRLREALEPFARADRAIGAEPGPFRFETANGHRLIERNHRAARLADGWTEPTVRLSPENSVWAREELERRPEVSSVAALINAIMDEARSRAASQ